MATNRDLDRAFTTRTGAALIVNPRNPPESQPNNNVFTRAVILGDRTDVFATVLKQRAIAAIAVVGLLCGLTGCANCWLTRPCTDDTYFTATGIPTSVSLFPDQDSIEIRILVRLTEEGASSEGADELMRGARLTFGASTQTPMGSNQIQRVRLMRADGSGVVLGTLPRGHGFTYAATIENVLSGCEGTRCSAELIAVVDLHESSTQRNIGVSALVEVDVRNCFEDNRIGWVVVRVESIDVGGTDSAVSLDGGT